MRVLGIETSCDETAAAVVENGRDVRSSIILSQIAMHRPYGGVVPEIACRSHVEALPGVIQDALDTAQVGWDDLDALAVTSGPGLASSLLTGVSAARGLALSTGLPLLPVNHLHGHLASLFLGDDVPSPEEICPALILLVSGGHSALVWMESWGSFRLLGQTVDDAAGEAFDKAARLLGLSYPGGPAIEKAAAGGDPNAVRFPDGRLKATSLPGGIDPRYCFSYSGLKTSLRTHLEAHPEAAATGLADTAASFQEAVVRSLVGRLTLAAKELKPRSLGCVGGVAKNQVLRAGLDALCAKRGMPLYLAPMAYCTDNAAMIAAAAGLGSTEAKAAFDVEPSMLLSAQPQCGGV